MSFTRDWLKTLKLDHSKFKTQPSYARDLMDDIADRVSTLLHGFLTTETKIGFKLGKFITIGTSAATTPPGTGDSASYDIYSRSVGELGIVELYGIDAAGNEIQLTNAGKIGSAAMDAIFNDVTCGDIDCDQVTCTTLVSTITRTLMWYVPYPEIGDDACAQIIIPMAATSVKVTVKANTAPSGGLCTIQLQDDGTDIMTSVLSIADGATSATTAVFDVTSIAADSILTLDIDAVNDAAGLTVLFEITTGVN